MAYVGLRGLAAAAFVACALAAACAASNDDGATGSVTAATTSTGGMGGSASGGGGSGGDYVDPNCEEQPCKLTAPQCGCRETERCNLVNDPLERDCVAIGTKGSSQACESDCEAGYMCVNNNTGGPAICHQFCDDDSDCSGAGSLCVLDVGAGAGTLCTHNCDPISSSGCEDPATKCDIASEMQAPNRSLTQCAGAGTLTQGQACTTTADCASGLGCLDVGGMMKQCLTWCRVSSPVCPGAETCTSFNPTITIGAVEYGSCI